MNMMFARAATGLVVLAAMSCGSDSSPAPAGGGGGGGGAAGARAGGSGGAARSGGSSGSPGSSTGGTGSPGVGSGGATGTGGAGGSGGRGAGGAAGAPGSGGMAGADASPADSEALARACTPRFTLMLSDTGPKGMIFTEAVGGNAEAFVQQIGREVCKVLYRQASEVRGANHIELQIKDAPGVAGKWGDVGDIGVEISTRHLQNVKNQGRDVKAEIAGILHHEMTHMYQNDDKPERTQDVLDGMYEGIADAVRIRNGFPPAGASPGSKSGRWQDKAYVEQAFFWLWVDTAHPDFIYKLNATMKGGDKIPWTPAEIQKITGKSGDQLWTEYQAAACCQGATRTCCK